MRIFYIVLDSFGIGASEDAHLYGDAGSDTLGHIADKTEEFSLPTLEKLGLGVIKPHKKISDKPSAAAQTAILKELSGSKDTTAGHWEMMGITSEGFTDFTKGFPKEIMDKFEQESGIGWIGNIPASGTAIIEDMGEEHLRTGKVIVYTSADSVFQIAAHVDVVPLEKLYNLCKIARKIVDPHNVSRVIARPFSGTPGNFFRLNNKRHDYVMIPPEKTFLEDLQENGVKNIGVGKIADIFSGRGIDDSFHTESNEDGMNRLLELQKTANEKSFVFANLVEFDSVYGHRRDLKGYYKALHTFDKFADKFISLMKNDDYLFLTADHGCDPSYKGTDHTRENVPLIVYSPALKQFKNHGLKNGFATAGATVLSLFKISTDKIAPLF